MKKRIGNDIQFTWHIYRKSGETQTPESFEGKEVEVKLISPFQQPVTIEDITIATGVVTFTFRGKHQVTPGNYVAVLQENRGEDGMVTLDVVNAVTLVAHSYMEEDGDDGDVIEASSVELDSEIGQGIDAYTKAETDNLFLRKRVAQGEHYAERGLVTTMVNTIDGVGVLSTYAYAGGIIIGHNTNTLTLSPDAIIKSAGYTSPVSVVWADTATEQIPAATTSANGLMSAADKGKLNALPTDTELTEELAGKQDTINDLATIRSGAQAGATAYQKPTTGIPATDLASDVQNDLAAIDGIEAVIPEQASESNQLADKDFVNSAIATATATYRGSYNLVTDLHLSVSATHAQIATALATTVQTADNNDYCYVQIPVADDTPTEFASVERYKFNGTVWEYEYTLNNSGFTAAQWAALNSGITSGLVAKLAALPTNSELATLLSGKADKSEMSVVPGTGTDADKTTITLKQGTSATVLTAHQDITDKENMMPITTATGATLTAVVGNYYRLDNVGTLAITLPTIVGATKLQAITFLLACGSNAVVTFVPQDSETILYQEDFALEADTTYEVTALWNGSEWTLSRVIYE